MGNRRKPIQLKTLQNSISRRDLGKKDPKPVLGVPEMPKWLDVYPIAVEEWERESKLLNDMEIMSFAECGLLAMRCYLASQIQKMAKKIETGEKRNHTQIKGLITEYRQHGSLLGLDYPSRRGIPIKTKLPSKVELFMDRKTGR